MYENALMGLFGLASEGSKKLSVWAKGQAIAGYDPSIWRRDEYGHAIRFSDYGDRSSQYGWEIDHIFPSALGGSDELHNLRPLHHARNASLGGLLGAFLDR